MNMDGQGFIVLHVRLNITVNLPMQNNHTKIYIASLNFTELTYCPYAISNVKGIKFLSYIDNKLERKLKTLQEKL